MSERQIENEFEPMFSDRIRMEKEFIQWAKNNGISELRPMNVIAWIQEQYHLVKRVN
jgi:hypothetical protein